jgi:hypothetical protein
VCAYLLSKGARVDVRDSDGDTALHVCESPECGELLVAAGADLTTTDAEGKTPYHVAVEERRLDMVQWLRGVYAARGLALPAVQEPRDWDNDDGEGDGEGGDSDDDPMAGEGEAGEAGAPAGGAGAV